MPKLKATSSTYSATWREEIWAAVRQHRVFCLDDLRVSLNASAARVRVISDYLTGLTRAGYLKHLGGERYQLARDTGPEAPQVKRDGSEINGQCVREAIWRTVKILGEFSLKDVEVHASSERCQVNDSDVRVYIRALVAAGYVVPRGRSGGDRFARYQFVTARNTGPRPPVVQQVLQVFDLNEGKVVFRAGGEA